MYNRYIHDKVRVLGIGGKQNKKLCNLHSLIINVWSITIGKAKILDNRGNFQYVKNWKKKLNLIWNTESKLKFQGTSVPW